MKFVAFNQPHRAFENVYAIFTKPFENQVETIKYKIWKRKKNEITNVAQTLNEAKWLGEWH